MPVELDIEETSLVSFDLNAPFWNALKNVEDNPNAFKAVIGEEDIFKHSNVISLPSTLIDTFLASPLKNPINLAIAFLTAMLSYNEDHKDDHPARKKMLDQMHACHPVLLVSRQKDATAYLFQLIGSQGFEMASKVHELAIMPRADSQ